MVYLPPVLPGSLPSSIAMSELWSVDAPTTDALEAALEGYVMTTGVSASFSRTAADWPTYDPDPRNVR